MANSISGKVLYFDSTTGASVAGLHRIVGVFWTSDEGTNLDIAADDDFLLIDSNSKVILGKRAEAAGDGLEVAFGFPGFPVDGITISKLDGGVCQI